MLLHEELSDQILNAFYEVYNRLRYGFLEKVYQNALFFELKEIGLEVLPQRRWGAFQIVALCVQSRREYIFVAPPNRIFKPFRRKGICLANIPFLWNGQHLIWDYLHRYSPYWTFYTIAKNTSSDNLKCTRDDVLCITRTGK